MALYSSLTLIYLASNFSPSPSLYPLARKKNVNDTSLWNVKQHITTLTFRQCPWTKHAWVLILSEVYFFPL